MVKKIELGKILELNPHIDPEILKKAIELAKELGELGAKGSRYNLISPYARRRVSTSGSNKVKSRTAGRRIRI